MTSLSIEEDEEEPLSPISATGGAGGTSGRPLRLIDFRLASESAAASSFYGIRSGNTIVEELLASTDVLFQGRLTLLLVLGPLAVLGDATGLLGEAACFCLAGIALIPCAERLSFVTEQVAEHTNGTIGALLNATFGNAPELLISVAALRAGYYRVVQLAMLGSMMTNMIFVFGMSCLIGGLRWQTQELRITSGNVNVVMLLVATAGSLFPAALVLTGQFENDEKSVATTDSATTTTTTAGTLRMMDHLDIPSRQEVVFSRVNAVVMLFLYVCFLIFQLGTHKEEFDDDSSQHHASSRRAKRNVFCLRHMGRARRSMVRYSTTANSSMSDHPFSAIMTDNHRHGLPKAKSSDRGVPRPTDNGGAAVSESTSFGEEDYDDDHSDSHYEEDLLLHGSGGGGGDVEMSVTSTPPINRRRRKLIGNTLSNGSAPNSPIPNRGLRKASSSGVSSSKSTSRHNDNNNSSSQQQKLKNSMEVPSDDDLEAGDQHDHDDNDDNDEDDASSRDGILRVGGGVGKNTLEAPSTAAPHSSSSPPPPPISMRVGIVWLFVITLCVSAITDILVDTIDGFAVRMKLSEVFTSMVIIPFFSNVAEQVSAFIFAYRNEMDLCVGVTVGSAIQIATFVLPGSVVIGWCLDRSMTLFFRSYETVSLFFGVVMVGAILQGGTTNWLVGAMLVGTYIIFAAGIWFHELETLTQDMALIGGNNTMATTHDNNNRI